MSWYKYDKNCTLSLSSKVNFILSSILIGSVGFFALNYILHQIPSVLAYASVTSTSKQQLIVDSDQMILEFSGQLMRSFLTERITPEDIVVAKKRSRELERLAQFDPEKFMLNLIHPEVFATADQSIKTHMEKYESLQGVFRAYINENPVTGKFENEYYIVNNNKHTRLVSLEETVLAQVKPGSTIKTDGITFGPSENHMVPSTADIEILATATPSESTLDRNAVLLVNFENDARQPWTQETIKNILFESPDSVKEYYLENTFEKIELTGDVSTKYYTIPMATCDWNEVFNDALVAADADFNFSSYDRVILIFPRQSCFQNIVGRASYGKEEVVTNDGIANLSKVWINGTPDLLTLGHEIGHTYGLYHANAWNCFQDSGDIYGPNCYSAEYGDVLSIMGRFDPFHMSSLHKYHAGWLDEQEVLHVRDDGQYTIAPINSNKPGVKALHVPWMVNEYNGEVRSEFILNYREAIGFDSVIDDDYVNINGVLVYRIDPYFGSKQPNIIDMSPENNFSYVSLPIGQTFTDINGTSFTPLSKTNEGIIVDVDMIDPPPCLEVSPRLEPAITERTISPGLTHQYSLRLFNDTAYTCSSATYIQELLLSDEMSDWNIWIDQEVITLAAGATANIFIYAQAPSGTQDGVVNSFQLRTTNRENSNLQAIADISLETLGQCYRINPEVAMASPHDIITHPGVSTPVQLQITNNDSQFCPSTEWSLFMVTPFDLFSTESLGPVSIPPGERGILEFNLLTKTDAPLGRYKLFIRSRSSSSDHQTPTIMPYAQINEFVDTEPPTIDVLEPISGSILSGNQTLSVIAEDVAKSNPLQVQMYFSMTSADEFNLIYTKNLDIIESGPLFRTEWDSSETLANGTYDLTTRACDSHNNCASSKVVIEIFNPVNPTILYPLDGERVQGPVTVETILERIPSHVRSLAIELHSSKSIETLYDFTEQVKSKRSNLSFKWDSTTVQDGFYNLQAIICFTNFTPCEHTTHSIIVANQQCKHNPLKVSLSPSLREVQSPSNITYNLEITNQDFYSCDPSFVEIQSANSTNWTIWSVPKSISIPPQTTKKIPLNMYIHEEARAGLYDVRVDLHSNNHDSTNVNTQLKIKRNFLYFPNIKLPKILGN